MCMILDKNRWGDFFKEKPDMVPIHNWLKKRNGKLVYSKQIMTDGEEPKNLKRFIEGKIKRFTEGRRTGQIKRGQIKRIDSIKVTDAINNIKNKYKLKSNDIHILGLAKASNTKLLCSNDKDLQKDFKKIIKGNIYTNEKNKALLTKDICP